MSLSYIRLCIMRFISTAVFAFSIVESTGASRHSISDPCQCVQANSVCEGEDCQGLKWVYPHDNTAFIYDDFSITTGLRSVKCDEAALILDGTASAQYLDDISLDGIANLVSRNNRIIIDEVLPQLKSFEAAPFDWEVIDLLTPSLHVRDPTTDLVLIVTANQAPFQEFVAVLDCFARIAPYSAIGAEFENSWTLITRLAKMINLYIEVLKVDLNYGFIQQVSHLRFWINKGGLSQPLLGPCHALECIGFQISLDRIRDRAAMTLNREPIIFSESIDRPIISVFQAIVVMLYHNEQELRNSALAHHALLLYSFESEICTSIRAVAEYIARATDSFSNSATNLLHALSMLCQGVTSIADRLFVSMIEDPDLRGFQVHHIRLPASPALIVERSLEFLSQSDLVYPRELIIHKTGILSGSSVEILKGWIAMMIQSLFAPSSSDVWTFSSKMQLLVPADLTSITDPPNRDQVGMLRASGRVIGLALKNDVSMEIPFDPIFVEQLLNHEENQSLAIMVIRNGMIDIIGALALFTLFNDELVTQMCNLNAF